MKYLAVEPTRPFMSPPLCCRFIFVKLLFIAEILLSTLSAKLPATLLFNCLASSAYPFSVVTRLFAMPFGILPCACHCSNLPFAIPACWLARLIAAVTILFCTGFVLVADNLLSTSIISPISVFLAYVS